MPEWIDGAFRFGSFLSFLGRIVSLLGFNRKLPSTRPEAERSWLLMVACAIDGTISVSTVMLRRGGSRARDDSDDNEGLVETLLLTRWVDDDRCSCILPFLPFFAPLSLPLPVLAYMLLCRLLRSSVTFEELTSFRSSSDFLCVVDVVVVGVKLR